MNILITGGAGYVGSACLRHLAQNGHRVVAFDDLRKGHALAVAENPLIEGDVADTALLVKTMREHEIEGVMHFAAATDVGESVTIPEYHYGNNVGGTLSLLNAMGEAGVGRILFSSTCATYGESQKEPLSDDTPLDPCCPFARSKVAVELMIHDFAEAQGLSRCRRQAKGLPLPRGRVVDGPPGFQDGLHLEVRGLGEWPHPRNEKIYYVKKDGISHVRRHQGDVLGAYMREGENSRHALGLYRLE